MIDVVTLVALCYIYVWEKHYINKLYLLPYCGRVAGSGLHHQV